MGSSVGLGHPTNFLVTLQFNCHSSVLSLDVTVLYCHHFAPSYTICLLPFPPSIKRNRVPPGWSSTAGSPLGINAIKSTAASPFLVDTPGNILIWMRCPNVVLSLTCKLYSSQPTETTTNTYTYLSITYINLPARWLRINCWNHQLYLSSLLFPTLLDIFFQSRPETTTAPHIPIQDHNIFLSNYRELDSGYYLS